MIDAGDDIQLFRLVCLFVGILAEITRVGVLSGYEEDGTRRDFFDLSERIEVGQCRLTCEACALVTGMLPALRIAVVVEELTLYCIGIFRESFRRAETDAGILAFRLAPTLGGNFPSGASSANPFAGMRPSCCACTLPMQHRHDTMNNNAFVFILLVS